MEKFGIGQGIKRFEDPRLVRGQGRFHGDVPVPGQAHATCDLYPISMPTKIWYEKLSDCARLFVESVFMLFTSFSPFREALKSTKNVQTYGFTTTSALDV